MAFGKKQRLIAAYLGAIGTCAVSITLIGAWGQALTAPPLVAGAWEIRLEGGVPPSGCSAWLSTLQAGPVRVAQSGQWLALTFADAAKTPMSAQMRASGILGEAATPVCGGRLRLEASVSGSPGSRLIRGQFVLAGCPACPKHQFRAALTAPSLSLIGANGH